MKDFQEFFQLAMDRSVPELISAEGKALNIGAGSKVIGGAIPLDYPEWDADRDRIPFGDEHFATIHAYHFLEHVKRPVDVLLEMQRVLRPGGVINVCVPYYTSQMFAHDLDHKQPFCEETWRVLFRNPYYDKNAVKWQLRERFNVICGIVERNLCLLTQLVKDEAHEA